MRKYLPADIIGWHDSYEWDRYNIINREIQHYAPKNLRNSKIVGNILQMTVIAEAVFGKFYNNDGDKWDQQPYSSAMFQSQDKEFVTTGDTVTIRCKQANALGIFAAFWLLRRDPVWAKTEIDIFETTKDIVNGEYHIAHHSHTAEGNTYQKYAGGVKTGADLVNTFNDYGVRIEETQIVYLFNGKPVKTVELHEHERNLEYYMLLNVAVAPAGHWAGGPEGSTYTWDKASLEVEHITVTRDDDTKLNDEVVAEIAATKPIDIDVGTTSPTVGDLRQMAEEFILLRYDSSTTLAKVLYDLARKFGGKL